MTLTELIIKFNVDPGNVEQELNELKSDIQGVAQEGQKASQQLGVADVAVGNLLADMAKWGARAIVSMAKTGVAYNAQIETYTAALTTALGNEAEAAAAIEQIKVDAARTPYSVDGLVKANTYLIQAGDSAEDARETILALTDAISASGGGNEELQRMAQNLQQIKNVGKATAMDIRQFAMAGIDIYGILADYTGKTTEEVKELEITYEMLEGALRNAAAEGGRFFEANLKQSQTLNGQLSTLSDNIDQTLGNAFSGVADILSSTVVPAANDFLQAINPAEATILVTALSTAIAGIGIKAAASIPAVKTLFATLGGAATAAAPILAVSAAFAALAIAAVETEKKADEFANTLFEKSDSVDEMKEKMDGLNNEIERYNSLMVGGFGAATMSMPQFEGTTKAVGLYKDAIEEAEAAEQETSYAIQQTTNTMAEQEARLQTLSQQYAATFYEAQAQVQGFFGMFEQVDQVQAASLQDMANGIQSQIAFNDQYQASLQTLADNGYGHLAERIQQMGTDGAQYALALSEAVASGNTAAVENISSLLDTLAGSQDELAATMTTASGQFDELLTRLQDTTAEPWTITVEDNSPEAIANAEAIAAAVNAIPSTKTVTVSIVQSGSVSTGVNVAGSHAQGLDYVPFDGYIAQMHKGERIMTAAENKAYTGGSTANQQPIQVNVNAVLELDGETVGRKTYSVIKRMDNDRGRPLVVGV